jgi:hypothetical protein
MIRCPKTGKAADSGIRTSGREAISSGLYYGQAFACPYCRELHLVERDSFLDVDTAAAAQGLWRPNR